MKKIITFVLVAALTLAAFSLITVAEKRELTIYNWGQYIGTGEEDTIDVIAEFEKATGITVNYITFDSNETLWTKLEMGGSNYDLVIPSDYMIGKLIANDMLEKLDFGNIPNYVNIDEKYRNLAFDPNNEYSVPYTFGTVGVIYNTQYVKEDVDSWDILWNEDYAGHILMFDNARDAFGIAELMLGYSISTEEKSEYDASLDLLIKQKPVLQGYVMDQIFDLLESGEAWIAPYYAGDYMTMKEENSDLAFCFPKEGFNYFFDSMCIPKGAEHKEEAEEFINFMLNPEIAGRNADAIGYATPVTGAKEYLSEEWANSDVVYPDDEVLERGRIFLTLSTETNQYMDKLWTELKVGDATENTGGTQTDSLNTDLWHGEYGWLLYALAGAVIGSLVTWFFLHENYKKRLYDDTSYYEKKKKGGR